MTTFIDPDGGDTLDYTYDAAGNEISKNNTSTSVSWTYGYNNSNQLIAVTETNTATSETMETVAYEYDALGNLLKETVTAYSMGLPASTTATEYAVDGWNPAKAGGMGNSAFDTWAVMNGSGALQTRNIQGNGIDQILARVDNYSNGASDPTGLYFDLTDRLGSVRDVLNSTPDASPVAVMTYDAWGNLISTPSSYQGMYGWDGYQIDEATSLYLDHARVYDPQSQRWIEQDPTWFDAGDSNLFRYVNNAPTNATDPSGLDEFRLGNVPDPNITHDKGSGEWNQTGNYASNIYYRTLKNQFLFGGNPGFNATGLTNIPGVGKVGSWVTGAPLVPSGYSVAHALYPDAANNLRHYFENSGTTLTIPLAKMINEVPSAKKSYEQEFNSAIKFVEAQKLAPGNYSFNSKKTIQGYNAPDESEDWYYAIGGYSAFGKGTVDVKTVDGKKKYTIKFTYEFRDRYNWDWDDNDVNKQKQAKILGITVKDKEMQEFHQRGLAKEFDMVGSVQTEFTWNEGQFTGKTADVPIPPTPPPPR